MAQPPSPILLCIGGHDPTGGAGIAADIESARALGCQPISLISALTRQDSHNVQQLHPNDPDAFQQQARCLLADIRPDIIKIGLIGSLPIAHAIQQLLEQRPDTPVILDPILAAGGGAVLARQQLIRHIAQQLAPRALLLTPNSPELAQLQQAGYQRPPHQWLITTGGHGSEQTDGELHHRLQGPLANAQQTQAFTSARLPDQYHGSGCTFASACAAHIAHGLNIPQAIQAALDFTHQALHQAQHPGSGQAIPQRINARPPTQAT